MAAMAMNILSIEISAIRAALFDDPGFRHLAYPFRQHVLSHQEASQMTTASSHIATPIAIWRPTECQREAYHFI